MRYLGSNSCNVTVGYKFLMKHIKACVLRQLHMIANNDSKQLIIPECHIGVSKRKNGNRNIFMTKLSQKNVPEMGVQVISGLLATGNCRQSHYRSELPHPGYTSLRPTFLTHQSKSHYGIFVNEFYTVHEFEGKRILHMNLKANIYCTRV